MANRDYFTKPLQGGGRNDPGYGRSNLYREPEPDPWIRPVLFFGAIILAYFIWQFSR